jgi:hypothetical protein
VERGSTANDADADADAMRRDGLDAERARRDVPRRSGGSTGFSRKETRERRSGGGDLRMLETECDVCYHAAAFGEKSACQKCRAAADEKRRG